MPDSEVIRWNSRPLSMCNLLSYLKGMLFSFNGLVVKVSFDVWYSISYIRKSFVIIIRAKEGNL